MAASDPDSRARASRSGTWATQAAWAVSGIVLAVILFELLDLRSEEERLGELMRGVRRGQLEVVEQALESGLDPGLTTPDGWTALHYASFYGRTELVEVLLRHGAPVDARHPLGWTPLHRAAEHGSVEVARLLIGRGAQIDARANGRSPLGVAISKRHNRLAGYLVEQGADLGELEPRSGLTPVLYAVMSGDSGLLRKLLAHGGDPNGPLRNGDSPLHLAARAGGDEIVRILLERGAVPNSTNAQGATPLHFAAESGSKPSVVLLVGAGGDPAIADGAGERPLDRIAPEQRALLGPVLAVGGD